MRTAEICPTCSVFTNALCTIYNGDYLPTLDINTLDSLEEALIKIEAYATTVSPTSLGDLINVDLTELTNNQVIQYDESTETWIPVDLPSSSSSGLERITEGSTSGWAYIGRTAANYGNIGNEASDLSYSTTASSTNGAIGQSSFAAGRNNSAGGSNSFVGGTTNIVSGSSSTAFGSSNTVYAASAFAAGSNNIVGKNGVSAPGGFAGGSNNTASGQYSTVFGQNNTASGYYSFSVGARNVAPSYGESVFGAWSTLYTATSETGYIAEDRAFNVGIGSSTINRRDGLTLLKSGKLGVNINNFENTTSAAILNVNGAIQTAGYTVATLPVGTIGMRAYVTDADSPTFLQAVTGGGSVVCPVFFNGSDWVCG